MTRSAMTRSAKLNLAFINDSLDLLDRLHDGEEIKLGGPNNLIVKSAMTEHEYIAIRNRLNEEAKEIINKGLSSKK